MFFLLLPLLSLIYDNILRKTISNNCLNEAKTIYSLDILAKDYLEKISVGYNKTEREDVKGLWKYRIVTLVKQIVFKVKEQKLNLPIWGVKKIIRMIKGE